MFGNTKKLVTHRLSSVPPDSTSSHPIEDFFSWADLLSAADVSLPSSVTIRLLVSFPSVMETVKLAVAIKPRCCPLYSLFFNRSAFFSFWTWKIFLWAHLLVKRLSWNVGCTFRWRGGLCSHVVGSSFGKLDTFWYDDGLGVIGPSKLKLNTDWSLSHGLLIRNVEKIRVTK